MYRTANTLFGQGSGPIFFTNVHCSGSEMNLLECPRTVFVGTTCTHSRDVGLRCQRKQVDQNLLHIMYCVHNNIHQTLSI